MANKTISKTKKEIIIDMTEMGFAINHIAKETGTCRETVRKYQKNYSVESLDSGIATSSNL